MKVFLRVRLERADLTDWLQETFHLNSAQYTDYIIFFTQKTSSKSGLHATHHLKSDLSSLDLLAPSKFPSSAIRTRAVSRTTE